MLDLAIKHAPRLQERYLHTLGDPRFKYYRRSAGWNYRLEIYPDSWEWLQMVSLNINGDVCGYIAAQLNRLTNTAYDVEAINFCVRNKDFSADLFAFVDFLFREMGMNRMVWNVVVANPVEQMYDRVASYFGGRIVGTFRQDVRLPDGQLYDLKWYEVLKDDFYREVARTGVHKYNYRDYGKEG